MSSVIGLNGAKDNKTKEERVRDFIKSMSAIEQAIEPFKEHWKISLESSPAPPLIV